MNFIVATCTMSFSDADEPVRLAHPASRTAASAARMMCFTLIPSFELDHVALCPRRCVDPRPFAIEALFRGFDEVAAVDGLAHFREPRDAVDAHLIGHRDQHAFAYLVERIPILEKSRETRLDDAEALLREVLGALA